MLLWLRVKASFALLVFCLTSLLSLSEPSTTVAAKSRDVFLITIDTLRADHIHCYGYDQIRTPALDALAVDGIRFSQAFTPSPMTNTSHASILTGLLPSRHGVADFGVPLSPAYSTLAELLKRQGYHTAAFIGAVILDSKKLAPGLDRGFDFYDNFPEHARGTSRWGRIERRGAEVVHHAEQWLDGHSSGPHFVWVHLYDPHDPYEPPPPYSQIYKDRLYDGEIAYADSALGGFISYLKRRGWYGNSVVVIVGDHGEGLGEHHEETHGIFLYDSTTHVPLILKLPGGTDSGEVVDAQVRTVDILPTVLDLVSIPVPDDLDGASLQPLLSGKEKAERTIIGETDYPLRFGWAPLKSARSEGFKFIEAPRPEFYELQTDARELSNKYEPWNPNVQTARATLAEVRAKALPSGPSRGAVPQGTLDELKALGYLTGADSNTVTSVPEPSLLPDPKDKIEEQNLLHDAMIAQEDGRTAEARLSLEKALELDPKFFNALQELGELELRSGDIAKAVEHLKSAAAEHPDGATTAFDEAQALARIADFAGAREALEKSLRLSPKQPRARIKLGEVYLGLKQPKPAEDQFEAALLLLPSSLEARVGLAKAHIAEGNLGQAVGELTMLSKSHPDSADVFDALSKAYARMGKSAEALNAGSRAKSLRLHKARQTVE